MKVLRLVMLFIIMIYSVVNAQASEEIISNWQGVYDFNLYSGRTQGGDAILYGIELTISPKGNCKVEEDGFQTMSRIKCNILKNGNGIDVLFKGYLKDNPRELGYKPNERLFSLSYDNAKKTLLTDWGAIEPDVKEKSGVYFKRKTKLQTHNKGNK